MTTAQSFTSDSAGLKPGFSQSTDKFARAVWNSGGAEASDGSVQRFNNSTVRYLIPALNF
jgi:hypothetical protein